MLPAEGGPTLHPGLTIWPLANPFSFHPLHPRLSIYTGFLGAWRASIIPIPCA